MPLRNTGEAWGWLARLLHWAMALLIVGMIGLGLYSARGFGVSFDDLMARKDLTQIHKSFGFTVFTLACLRLIWRAVSRVPDPPANISEDERLLARAVHGGFYVLMFAVPLAGWMYASSSPLNDADAYPVRIPNMVFGLFEMPDPYPEGDRAISELWFLVHQLAAFSLAALLFLHVNAALWHHFVRRDSVLTRMLTGRRRR